MTLPPELTIRPATMTDLDAISALHEAAFGPGRFARTAYRVREGTPPVTRFCRAAEVGGKIVAALRFTPIRVGATGAALLLGPVAIAPDAAGKGYGRALIARAIEDARSAGQHLVLLVGDMPYYSRFGFTPVPPGQITLPGPVNPARLLALELEAGALARFQGHLVAASD